VINVIRLVDPFKPRSIDPLSAATCPQGVCPSPDLSNRNPNPNRGWMSAMAVFRGGRCRRGQIFSSSGSKSANRCCFSESGFVKPKKCRAERCRITSSLKACIGYSQCRQTINSRHQTMPVRSYRYGPLGLQCSSVQSITGYYSLKNSAPTSRLFFFV